MKIKKSISIRFSIGILLSVFLLTACNGEESESQNKSLQDSLISDTLESQIDPGPQPIQFDAHALSLTGIAHFMAGMPFKKDTGLDSLRALELWSKHQTSFDDLWEGSEENQLSKIKTWSEKHLSQVWDSTTHLFYPFSGPDFLYADLFFPNANKMILAGLEPVGKVPDFSKETQSQLNNDLKGLKTSLDDIMRWSFFKTNDMKKDFKRTQIEGIVPVIMVFMARAGYYISEIESIRISKDGEILQQSENVSDSLWEVLVPGAWIKYAKPGETELRELFYFAGNISNSGIIHIPEFETFTRSQLQNPATFLKSATYLLHKDYFSVVRDIIMEESCAVLEDDSGLPWKEFDQTNWDVSLYGNYVGPIGLFSNWFQNDLDKAYKANTDNEKLDFGIGYRYRLNESNLLLAIRKKEAAGSLKGKSK